MNHHPRDIMPEFGNLAAEQALLGAMFVYEDAFNAVPATLSAEHFSEKLHGAIFEAARAMKEVGKRVNPSRSKRLSLKAYWARKWGRRPSRNISPSLPPKPCRLPWWPTMQVP